MIVRMRGVVRDRPDRCRRPVPACGGDDNKFGDTSSPSRGGGDPRLGRHAARRRRARRGRVLRACRASWRTAPQPIILRTRADARRFNEELPCGARLLRTSSSAGYTTAVFRLTERPGPGTCGTGTGMTARTTFVDRATARSSSGAALRTHRSPPGRSSERIGSRRVKQLAPDLWMLSGFPPNGINIYLMGDVLVDAGTRHSGRRIFRQIEGHDVKLHALTHAHPGPPGREQGGVRAARHRAVVRRARRRRDGERATSARRATRSTR